MKPKLYQRVALLRNWPEAGLRRGDVATVVEFVPHPANGEEGCVLEIFNALGESLRVATVPQSLVEPLAADDIPSIRRLVTA
jgi:hypothetical protein